MRIPYLVDSYPCRACFRLLSNLDSRLFKRVVDLHARSLWPGYFPNGKVAYLELVSGPGYVREEDLDVRNRYQARANLPPSFLQCLAQSLLPMLASV